MNKKEWNKMETYTKHFHAERRLYGFAIYVSCPNCGEEIRLWGFPRSTKREVNNTLKNLEKTYKKEKKHYISLCLRCNKSS